MVSWDQTHRATPAHPLVVEKGNSLDGNAARLYIYIFYYIYITPVNNLPLGARKPQRFTNIYNEQYN